MTNAATTAEPAPLALTDAARAARALRRLQRLDELADIGMDIAKELRRQILEQQGSAPELAHAFDRVSRAVRLTQMLQEKSEQDQETRAREAADRAAGERARKVERKANAVRGAVRGILDVETEADETLDDCALHGELLERLDREADDERFLDRPLGEIVARICSDLGLQPDWSLWEGEPWAAEAAKVEPPPLPHDPPRLPEPPDPDKDPRAFIEHVSHRMRLERRAASP